MNLTDECVCCKEPVPLGRLQLCGWCRKNLGAQVSNEILEVWCRSHNVRVVVPKFIELGR